MVNNRSGKFYRNNEKQIMQSLGLEPTPNSGSGWIVKEDGQNDNVICQLKSTDANSIKLNKQDLDKLNYNSLVSHKLPLFVFQFLQSNEIYLVIKPEVLKDIVNYIETGEVNKNELLINLSDVENTKPAKPVKTIKSSSKSRMAFSKATENKYKKQTKSAT